MADAKKKTKQPKSVHEEQVVGKIFDWQIYRRLAPFARPYVKNFVLSVIMLVALAATTMAVPFVMKTATDDYLVATGTPMQDRVDGLASCALLLAGIGAATFVLRYGQLWLANITGQRIIFDLRQRVFRHIQSRNLRFFDKNPVGRLVTRVTSDIEAQAELFSSGIDVLFYDIVMIVLILGVLFWINVTLALWTLAIMPIIAIWSFVFKKEAQQLFRNVRAKVTRLNSYINECVTGIRVIQIFRTEKRTNERFREWNDELRDAHLGTVRNFSLFYPGVEVFSSVGTATILIVGHGLHTGGTLSVGDMLAFWYLMHRFFEPLRQISEKYNVLQSAIASSERIFKLLDDDSEIRNAPDARPLALKPGEGSIRFENVSFSYDGETPVLKDVSFDVRRGEKLAIVGATGSGKTSIINVLGRFYDIQGGRVLVGGDDVTTLDKRTLRRSIGIVLQDVFLFADTLRENLRLGDESYTDEDLARACSIVYANRLVDRLADGFDHEVQERGATFSLGEKQLLAFARTLVHDPPILVLDEATANIDSETEHYIQMALDRLMENRTSIVIAHRLSTIKKADRILVLHKGEIREEGTHAELLKKNGLYRRLYELQYKNQEAA